MGAVFEKEFRQYAASMMGAVFLTAFFALTGYYFVVGNLSAQDGRVEVLFQSVFMLAMFLCPMLTMRSFAEERKMRTEQLLLTAPIPISQVVLGKFFASWCFFLCGSLVVVLDAAILAFYGSVQPLVLAGNLVGLGLASGAFLALGIFLSSLTENLFVAAVISYSALLGLWLVDFLQPSLQNPILLKTVQYLSCREHFRELSGGIFSLSTLVYFLGACLLFLALTTLRLKKNR